VQSSAKKPDSISQALELPSIDVLDFEIDRYPAKFIANMLNLSLEQVQIALDYIDTHRTQVEAEYQSILRGCLKSFICAIVGDESP
jgi:transcription antitermination factor NusA-like protein